MIAGLPGTGIGGLFYVLSALWAPVRNGLFRRAALLRQALGLACMAAGVMIAIWATGWGVGELVHRVAADATMARTGGIVLPASNLVHRAALLLALATLVLVLGLVELTRVVLRVRPAVAKSDLLFRSKREPRKKAAA